MTVQQYRATSERMARDFSLALRMMYDNQQMSNVGQVATFTNVAKYAFESLGEFALAFALREQERDTETLGVHLGCCIEETPREAEEWG